MTKSDILATVQGYRQKYSPNGDNTALERQFERDKDDIRELGVPLETLDDPAASGNNQMLRYRIPRGAYELPLDIAFSSEETALLTLAAMVWREGTLSGESRRALLKLRSLGGTATVPGLDYAPRIRSRDAAFEPLRDALDRGVLVRFPYLKPGESEARKREVAPFALIQHQGRWMVSCLEPDTGRRKTFLLSRIIGPVVITAIAVERPVDATAESALAALDEVWRTRTALIRVVAGSDAETRLTKRRSTVVRDDCLLEIHFSDEQIVADELASFGPEVTVLEPASVRDLVIARLRRLVAVHTEVRAAGGSHHG
nr:WYL domain-containing protein [Frigoribacterium sp. CFBP 13712]